MNREYQVRFDSRSMQMHTIDTNNDFTSTLDNLNGAHEILCSRCFGIAAHKISYPIQFIWLEDENNSKNIEINSFLFYKD